MGSENQGSAVCSRVEQDRSVPSSARRTHCRVPPSALMRRQPPPPAKAPRRRTREGRCREAPVRVCARVVAYPPCDQEHTVIARAVLCEEGGEDTDAHRQTHKRGRERPMHDTINTQSGMQTKRRTTNGHASTQAGAAGAFTWPTMREGRGSHTAPGHDDMRAAPPLRASLSCRATALRWRRSASAVSACSALCVRRACGLSAASHARSAA